MLPAVSWRISQTKECQRTQSHIPVVKQQTIMPKNNFDKFIKGKSNAAKKEEFRQAKRKIKKEIAEGMARTRARKAEEAAKRAAAPQSKRSGPAGFGTAADQKGGGHPQKQAATARPAQKAATTNAKGAPATPQMPLNKFIAHGGVCSRREAAELVKQGQVKVNGKEVLEPGFKVSESDDVRVSGKKIVPTGELVYLLLNKPKDYITTSSDPEGRKTVLDLVRKATTERVFPVGRLDRNTTGVLLLTNDGELAQKLAHPAYEVKKVYEVRLDKDLTKKDFDAILSGVTLDDGLIQPDALAYADTHDKSVVGIEIHSGKNRIVRRIFEHLGYSVKNLDRVMYAGLTKKNVDRGRWRFLNEKEVRLLKYLNTSFARKKPHPGNPKDKS